MIDTLLTTKLQPPRLHQRLLLRPGLLERLSAAKDYRLTVLQAGAGYGKTTTLAALARHLAGTPFAWYALDTDDRDPQRFLAYLIAAVRQAMPAMSFNAEPALQEAARAGTGGLDLTVWLRVVDVLLNDLNQSPHELLVILDDLQWVAESPALRAILERMLRFLPPQVHLLLASRQVVDVPGMLEWQAKGEVLQLGAEQLALDQGEIAALFRNVYGIVLTEEEVAALQAKTAGWPIALQLAWQGLRTMSERTGQSDAVTLMRHGPQALAALFAYLAREVFDRQPEHIRRFLLATAVLRELSDAACAAVSGQADTHQLLARLEESGLFMTAIGNDRYRYHPLFQDFLIAQLPADEVRLRHAAAAEFYAGDGNYEQAIHHFLGSGAQDRAADVIAQVGESVLAIGRLDTLETWLRALPPDIGNTQPRLTIFEGDLARLRGRLDFAIEHYRAAERTWRQTNDAAGISLALRSQALVYLDSGVQTQDLLTQALALAEHHAAPDEKQRLLELLAENTLNIGDPKQAEALWLAARALKPNPAADDRLSVRLRLRTGRVHDAKRILHEWWRQERQAAAAGQVSAPAAHRETALLLSFIHAAMGEPQAALECAQAGIERGQRLRSPMLVVFGHTRLGHAWQLQANALPAPACLGRAPEQALDAAMAAYREALRMTDEIGMRRGRLEVMFGLTRLAALQGDLAAARRHAAEARDIAAWCGDAWIGAHVELVLAAAELEAGQAEPALATLPPLLERLRACGDTLGQAAVLLQLALADRQLGRPQELAQNVDALLEMCQTHDYDFLLTAPSLFGLTEVRRAVPLLIHACSQGGRAAYAVQLLLRMGVPEIELHPGFQLRVQSLSGFRVWRGNHEIEARDWRRGSARELFQLLLAERGRWLTREQIMETLRPGIDPEASVRDFKAALAALTAALEPERSAEQASSFIAREGAAYRLRPEADIWHDADLFESESGQGLRMIERDGKASDAAMEHLQLACRLYAGEFLPESRDAEWTAAPRERLGELYQRSALRLAEALLGRGSLDSCIETCRRVLERDPCCERAYQLTMLAYARRGARSDAVRAYQRCAEQLRKELQLAPSGATLALLQQITGDMPAAGSTP